METEVKATIKALLSQAEKTTIADNALKFSQAALNVANCGSVVKDQQK